MNLYTKTLLIFVIAWLALFVTIKVALGALKALF